MSLRAGRSGTAGAAWYRFSGDHMSIRGMTPDRNVLVQFAAAALLACAAAAVQAAAPMLKTQAPGYYRLMVGDFEITALSDGTTMLPVKDLLINATPEEITHALARVYLESPV